MPSDNGTHQNSQQYCLMFLLVLVCSVFKTWVVFLLGTKSNFVSVSLCCSWKRHTRDFMGFHLIVVDSELYEKGLAKTKDL